MVHVESFARGTFAFNGDRKRVVRAACRIGLPRRRRLFLRGCSSGSTKCWGPAGRLDLRERWDHGQSRPAHQKEPLGHGGASLVCSDRFYYSARSQKPVLAIPLSESALFRSQGHCGIHSRRLAGRNKAGDQRDQREKYRNSRERQRIPGGDAPQRRLDQAG